MAEIDDEAVGRPRKLLSDAIEAFHAQHIHNASETKRKYKRVLKVLSEYCTRASLRSVDQVQIENMDGYALWRNPITKLDVDQGN
jgi:hypothetical protein